MNVSMRGLGDFERDVNEIRFSRHKKHSHNVLNVDHEMGIMKIGMDMFPNNLNLETSTSSLVQL